MSGILSAILNSKSSDISGSIMATGTPTATGGFFWVVPVGVTSISAVAISGGEPGLYEQYTGCWYCGCYPIPSSAKGGKGGTLSYVNNIPVTPGETLRLIAGAGYSNPTSTIIRVSSNTVLLQAHLYAISRNIGTYNVGGKPTQTSVYYYGAVINAVSGGGAAGYSGAGGNATTLNGAGTEIIPATAGSGGGGGGGYASTTVYTSGGGTGIYGEGANGAGGTSSSPVGKGGSGGSNGRQVGSISANGGNYGGGGAGGDAVGNGGGGGAVRIVWGTNRMYPSTNVGA